MVGGLNNQFNIRQPEIPEEINNKKIQFNLFLIEMM